MILAMLKAEGHLFCAMIELHISVRCCVITGFSIFRSLKEHWSGPVDDLFGKLSITFANWDSWIGSSSHSGCVIMTLRMESSIASEFKLVCWRGVLNLIMSVSKTISLITF